MNISAAFINRPVGTSLLTVALALAGAVAFRFLPVSPIPQVEFPTIQVQAALPGASPETMASAVAMPLERQFGRIAGVTDMTSTSYLGSTAIVVGTIIGSGIFLGPHDVARQVGSVRTLMLVWSLCGLLALVRALSLSELVAPHPEAGGVCVSRTDAY